MQLYHTDCFPLWLGTCPYLYHFLQAIRTAITCACSDMHVQFHAALHDRWLQQTRCTVIECSRVMARWLISISEYSKAFEMNWSMGGFVMVWVGIRVGAQAGRLREEGECKLCSAARPHFTLLHSAVHSVIEWNGDGLFSAKKVPYL